MLTAPRRTFGPESNFRAPRLTSGLEMIFPASIILLLTLLTHLVNYLPKQRVPPPNIAYSHVKERLPPPRGALTWRSCRPRGHGSGSPSRSYRSSIGRRARGLQPRRPPQTSATVLDSPLPRSRTRSGNRSRNARGAHPRFCEGLQLRRRLRAIPVWTGRRIRPRRK